jgi:Predicted membrane protein (DUF2335)
MDEPTKLQGARAVGRVVEHQQTIYQGPLPQPEDFAAYDRVLPGAADRILKMAEGQATHRQGLERFAVRGDFFKALMGTVLEYIAFAGAVSGAVFLLFHDKPIESLGTFIVAVGSAFGPKVYVDFIQPRPDARRDLTDG